MVADSEMTNVVELMWCVLRSEAPADIAARFWDVTAEHYPAGVPHRYGTTESNRGKINEVDAGRQGFIDLWDSGEYFFWRPKRPFFFGTTKRLGDLASPGVHVGVLGSRVKRGTSLEYALVGKIEVRLDASALDRPGESERMREYFTAISEAFSSFFSHASVERKAPKKSRGDLKAELGNPSVMKGSHFLGLPPGDSWLVYFDDRYKALLDPHLDFDKVGDGFLYEVPNAWEGLERKQEASLVGKVPDELLPLEPAGFGRVDAAPVIPEEFRQLIADCRYRAWVYSVVDFTAEQVADALRGATAVVVDEQLVEARFDDGWGLRLRSSRDATEMIGTGRLKRYYVDGAVPPNGGELAASRDDYCQMWEVTGTSDDDMVHLNDWLFGIEDLCSLHPNTIWLDIGPPR